MALFVRLCYDRHCPMHPNCAHYRRPAARGASVALITLLATSWRHHATADCCRHYQAASPIIPLTVETSYAD